jgi:hypothetical protein
MKMISNPTTLGTDAPGLCQAGYGRGLLRCAFFACGLLASALSARAQLFVAEWAEPDIGRVGATGLALDTVGGITYLYVSDENHGRIIKYNTATGARVGVFGANGNGDGEFNNPYGIAIDPTTHDLYVAERGNHRIQRITNTGVFVMKWGSVGTAVGQFDGPVGIAVDATGNVYVVDHNNNRVEKFHVTGSGTNWQVQTVGAWGSFGSGAAQFDHPYGITRDASGNLWVADGFNHRIQKFDTNGNFLGVIGIFGTGDGQFVTPTWVNFDAAGNFYVAETNSNPQDLTAADIQNQRIQKFTAAGAFVTKWGSYGEAGGQFRLPFSAVIDANGFAYVADYYNTRIEKFDLSKPVTGGGGNTLASQSVAIGSPATFTATATAGATYQWQRNGTVLAGQTSNVLTIASVQPSDAGVYTVTINNGATSSTQAGVLGVTTTLKVAGQAQEVQSDIVHPNKNVYDQVLLQGAAGSVRADANQVTRTSFIDMTDEIVQVEFSGAGTLTIVLDGATGPAAPAKYNQPGVLYMRGHANIIVAGANETTNVSVFSVGRNTAVNQALFRSDVSYDGMADIGSVSIASTNGKFGGVRAANANYWNIKGYTGVYAPGIQFVGPVYTGDLSASDTATPVIFFGSSVDDQVNGGDLLQANGRGVQVNGITQLKFVANATSQGGVQPQQTIKGRLMQDGVDVTSTLVVYPSP